VQTTMVVKLGQQNMAHYSAANISDRQLTGSAVFNVTPVSAGAYFNKIECFCFTEHTLQPGESADLPVVFFVDPAILDDPDTRSVREITLSYTFYPVDKPKPVSQAKASGGGVSN
ncbi:MAG: cytochrome c oxidase assembly protein, partial [Aestuariivirga sp.]